MRGQWRRLGFLIATFALPTPAIAQPTSIPRIVAVGDLHGDFSAWRDIARAAGLVDADGHWEGGATVLVQTGDVVDRGPDSLSIIDELMRLQAEAPAVGGRVVTLVGNHEAMNMTDDLRYVAQGDFAAFVTPDSAALRDRVYEANRTAIEATYRKRTPGMRKAAIRLAWLAATPLGQVEHQAAWHPHGRIGDWVARNPAAIQFDGTLFVHGGLSAAYARYSLDEINRRVDAALAAPNPRPNTILTDPLGPLWYRGLIVRDPADAPDPDQPSTADEPNLSIDDELDLVLKAYHAQRIVVGHTPILGGIAVTPDGKLIRIDTGISSVYGGTPSYLEILDGVATPHAVARSSPPIPGAQ